MAFLCCSTMASVSCICPVGSTLTHTFENPYFLYLTKNCLFLHFKCMSTPFELTDVNYREDASIKIMGVHFNTFYGGSDSTWYPQALMSADFKNFALDAYSDSPLPSDVADNCIGVQCAEHAICKSSYRQFECVCQSGYKGDGKTACVATGTSTETTDKPASQGCNSVDIGLTCSPSQMAFIVHVSTIATLTR